MKKSDTPHFQGFISPMNQFHFYTEVVSKVTMFMQKFQGKAAQDAVD